MHPKAYEVGTITIILVFRMGKLRPGTVSVINLPTVTLTEEFQTQVIWLRVILLCHLSDLNDKKNLIPL